MPTIRIFLDATVLFSATKSKTGASRELFRLAQRGFIELVTNEYAVAETRANLVAKVPEIVTYFELLVRSTVIMVFDAPTQREVDLAAMYTVFKDAAIVAGAISTHSDYLATFDRKHLIDPPEVAEKSGVIIATSGEILEQVRKELDL